MVKRAGTENFRYHAKRREDYNQTEGSADFLTNNSYSYVKNNNTKLEIYAENIDRDGIQKMISIKTTWDADFDEHLDIVESFDIIVYAKDFAFQKFEK